MLVNVSRVLVYVSRCLLTFTNMYTNGGALWGKYLGYSFVDKGACTHKIRALLILLRVILFYTSIIPYIEYIFKVNPLAFVSVKKLTGMILTGLIA